MLLHDTIIPWFSIWVKPRKTIRQILDRNPAQFVLLLSALSGIYRFLEQAAKRSLGDHFSLLGILILSVIAGSLIGMISVYISAAFFRWVGSWLGGTATSAEVRCAIAWSSVPDVVQIIIFCPVIILVGRDYFTSSADWITPWAALLILAIGAIGMILFIWRGMIFVSVLAEVHQFSFWKGLLTAVLGLLIVIIPVGLLLIGQIW